MREITEKPPMSLTDSLDVANIVCARNGCQMTDLHRKIDLYSAYRSCPDKDQEITRLKQTISNIWTDKAKGNGGGGAYGNGGGGTYGQRNQGNHGHGAGGSGGRGAGAQVHFGAGQGLGGRVGKQTPRDPAYNEIKKTLCRYFILGLLISLLLGYFSGSSSASCLASSWPSIDIFLGLLRRSPPWPPTILPPPWHPPTWPPPPWHIPPWPHPWATPDIPPWLFLRLHPSLLLGLLLCLLFIQTVLFERR